MCPLCVRGDSAPAANSCEEARGRFWAGMDQARVEQTQDPARDGWRRSFAGPIPGWDGPGPLLPSSVKTKERALLAIASRVGMNLSVRRREGWGGGGGSSWLIEERIQADAVDVTKVTCTRGSVPDCPMQSGKRHSIYVITRLSVFFVSADCRRCSRDPGRRD